VRSRPFRQVDVFTAEPYRGNPVAVVLDGSGLTDAQMGAFARWTNLSETTFVLPPTDAAPGATADGSVPPPADYRLRIFTPGGELPFAGHPTLGSCHAWVQAGGTPRDPGRIVQECGVGLVPLRRDGGRLAFAAPPLRREGPADEELLARIAAGLGVDRSEIRAHAWIDNGPGWVGVLLDSAERVLALRPDFAILGDTKLGVVAPQAAGGDTAFEVRAFYPDVGGASEDPVTGSLNAGIAQWLRGAGLAPASYVAAQGAALQRAGRIHVEDAGDAIWVGGDCVTCIAGTVTL
jgi:PhzF family phenazine biosynthesis protein